MKQRKRPQRTCVGCGETHDKRLLMRVVRLPEGGVELDPTGKRNGRGAYVHLDKGCIERACRHGRLLRSLKVDPAQVAIDEIEAALLERSSGGGAKT